MVTPWSEEYRIGSGWYVVIYLRERRGRLVEARPERTREHPFRTRGTAACRPGVRLAPRPATLAIHVFHSSEEIVWSPRLSVLLKRPVGRPGLDAAHLCEGPPCEFC